MANTRAQVVPMEDRARVVRLLGAIVVLLALLVVGAGAGLIVSIRAARAVEVRQQAAVAQMLESSTSARQALARFEQERLAISGDPGGPLGRLDRQIQLMGIMVNEQMVLISEMAGLHEAAARAIGGPAPAGRPEARAAPPRKR